MAKSKIERKKEELDVEAWSDGKRRDGGKYRERRIEMEGDKQRSD